jgi:hypothetical protein
VEWVDHREVIPEDCLPTFSSHAIESRLQHIPGLAEHFVYLNDDVFLMRPTRAADFFEATGMSKSFMEEYGSVSGEVHLDDPDYLNAARNGKRLLENEFKRSPTALHKHTAMALRKDVLLEMQERFAAPIRATTARRFRTPDDISSVSFLYHHYAYLTGRALYAPCEAELIRPQSPGYEATLEQILVGHLSPLTVCLNDGGGSARRRHWHRRVVEFLEAAFPATTELERRWDARDPGGPAELRGSALKPPWSEVAGS